MLNPLTTVCQSSSGSAIASADFRRGERLLKVPAEREAVYPARPARRLLGALVGQSGDRAPIQRQRLLEPVLPIERRRERGERACHGDRIVERLEQLNGLFQALFRASVIRVQLCRAAGLVEQPRARRIVLGELGRAVERSRRLGSQCQRQRPFAGVGERLARRGADPRRIGRVGIGGGGVEEVGRQHLGELRRLLAPDLLQMTRGGEMTALAVLARQRPVCGRPQQPAEEVVLAAFGGQAVVVEAEDLLGNQPVKDCRHGVD